MDDKIDLGASSWAWPGASGALTAGLLAVVQLRMDPPVLLAERFLPGAGWIELGVLALYATAVVRIMMVSPRPSRWRARLWTLFSIVFFGQLALGLAGVEECLMTGTLHLPIPAVIIAGPLFRGFGFFMPVLLGATLLVTGRAWCSHLCYVGAWDLMASRVRAGPHPLPSWRFGLRWAILAGVVASALLLRLTGVPMAAATWIAAAFGIAGAVVAAVFTTRTGQMVHCTTWCPVGTLVTAAGRISPFRVALDESCTGCGRCAGACRYDALTPKRIADLRPGPSCTVCGDCLESCPEKAMGYRFPGLSAENARRLFLTLTLSIHAVFIGLARI